MMSCNLLPDPVYSEIQASLSKADYRYFINSSKVVFGEVKRKTVYFNLNPSNSEKYLDDADFRRKILSLIENGWRQIALHISWTSNKKISLTVPIHSLIYEQPLRSVRDLDHLTNVESMILYPSFHEIPPLMTLKHLTLENTDQMSPLSNLSHLTSISINLINNKEDLLPLQFIKHLKINNCDRIEDFSILGDGKQISLSLGNACNLTNVNNFQSIHQLSLSGCSLLEDISPLYGIHTLQLSFCKKVKDISSLGNHYRLEILDCSYEIIVYESLMNIPHIILSYCNIKDLTVLSNSKTVELNHCKEVVDLTPLQHLQSVHIAFCPNALDLSILKNVKKLQLETSSKVQLESIKDLSNETFILKLSTHTIHDFSFVRRMKHFTLAGCYGNIVWNEETVQCFQHLQSLALYDCGVFTNVNGFGHIPEVTLCRCYDLTDISGFGGNRSVCLQSLRVRDFSSLANVPIVTLIDCVIQSPSVLCNVPRLTILNH